MDTPISTEKVREKASQICLEYLQVMAKGPVLFTGIVNISTKEKYIFIPQGVWRIVPANQLQIRQISGGLSNLVFFVGLPPGIQPKGPLILTLQIFHHLLMMREH